MTGDDLRKARMAARLSQTALAQRAGIGRQAVSYWECRAKADPKGWAVKRLLKALGLSDLPYFPTPAMRAYRDLGGWSASPGPLLRCGAFRNDGKPCRHRVEPGKKRCKFHGGCSTGPKTAEGRARIAEAQRQRWAKWHAERASAGS